MIGSVLPVALFAILLIAAAALRSHQQIRRWLGFDPVVGVRTARAALLILAIVATAIALVQLANQPPSLGGASLDVVLLIDVSRSMDTTDAPPSRLRRAVRLVERLLDETEGVRFGLVLFAGDSFPALPLTQDRDAVLTYVRGLDTDLISHPGTDLARALRVSSRVFDPTSSRPRTVLLLTDGEHSGGDLADALQETRARGIRIVAVGFGTRNGGIVPTAGADSLRDAYGQVVRSRRTDPVLEQVASATDGTFLREEERPLPASLLPPPPPSRDDDESRDVRIPAWVLLALIAVGLEIYLSSPRSRRTTRAVATTLVGALLLGAGPGTWLREGDVLLEGGNPKSALSLYRKVERSRGPTPATRIRIGNALYRLEQLGPAAGAYLEALRALEPEDREARYLSAFNLGTVLLAQERYGEARDALWTALVARSTSMEAKFNYEWAVDHLPPDDEPVAGSSRERRDVGEEEEDSPLEAAEGEERPDLDSDLSPGEAERWLRSIREEPGEPLRQQIIDELEGRGRRSRGGQTW